MPNTCTFHQWGSDAFHKGLKAMVDEERRALKQTTIKMTKEEVRQSCLFVILGLSEPAGTA